MPASAANSCASKLVQSLKPTLFSQARGVVELCGLPDASARSASKTLDTPKLGEPGSGSTENKGDHVLGCCSGGLVAGRVTEVLSKRGGRASGFGLSRGRHKQRRVKRADAFGVCSSLLGGRPRGEALQSHLSMGAATATMALSTRRARLPQFLPHTTKQPETTRNTRKQVPLCFAGISQ